MDRLIEFSMSKLFQLAEYVCNKFEAPVANFVVTPVANSVSTPVTPPVSPSYPTQPQMPTIHFSEADNLVEGDLFA